MENSVLIMILTSERSYIKSIINNPCKMEHSDIMIELQNVLLRNHMAHSLLSTLNKRTSRTILLKNVNVSFVEHFPHILIFFFFMEGRRDACGVD